MRWLHDHLGPRLCLPSCPTIPNISLPAPVFQDACCSSSHHAHIPGGREEEQGKAIGLPLVTFSPFQRTFPEDLPYEFLLFQWPELRHMATPHRKRGRRRSFELDALLLGEHRGSRVRMMGQRVPGKQQADGPGVTLQPLAKGLMAENDSILSERKLTLALARVWQHTSRSLETPWEALCQPGLLALRVAKVVKSAIRPVSECHPTSPPF